jgi:hypothetical protein
MEHAKTASRTVRILQYGVITILVLLPFHALFTTWLGSTFGYLDLFRIWKELLIALMVPMASWLVYKDRQLRVWFKGSRLVLLVLLYVLLHLLMGMYALATNKVNPEALIYALLINLRFPVFLLLMVIVAAKTDLKKHWPKIILWPAAVVVTFGLLQQFVLPTDFLTHFGYGQETIPAAQTVDEKPEYRRIQSTLRGANPFGAYLLVLIIALVALMLRKGSIHQESIPRALYAVYLVPAMLLLFFTYSRSAWLGLLAALAFLVFWKVRPGQRRLLLIAAAAFTLFFAGTVWLLRDNDRVQNTLFHSDESSLSSESSNAGRLRQLQAGAQDILHEPLGRGPGTAGPASVRNDQPARIAENYYVQIAQEVGIIGLAFFIVIYLWVARTLWRQRRDPLSQILLASLLGLTLINLLSHAWTDDTLSLIWWGLAGLVIGSRITQKSTHLE